MSAETEYKVVRRLPNGNEVILDTFDQAVGSQSQIVRAATLQFANSERTNNPAWRILIYGPTNGGDYTADDIVWDSLTNPPE